MKKEMDTPSKKIDPMLIEAPEMALLLEAKCNEAIAQGKPSITIGPRTAQRLIGLLRSIKTSQSGHKYVYSRQRKGKPYHEVLIRVKGRPHRIYHGESLEEALHARDAFLEERKDER